MSKKGEKKSSQNFFKLKYIIKNFKTSNFYYLKILLQLNFLWRYESSKFLIFTSKIHVKSETLAMKNVKPTAKKQDIFELELDISDTLGCNVFLVLFCGKKSKSGMKSEN